MIDDRSALNNEPSPPGQTVEEQRQFLELELIRIRNEASAARLDARAAEVELMIRQLRSQNLKPGSTVKGIPINTPHINSIPRIASWGELRRIQAARNTFSAGLSSEQVTTTQVASSEADAFQAVSTATEEVPSTHADDVDTPVSEVESTPIVRHDRAETAVDRPRFLDLADDQPEKITFAAEELDQAFFIDEDADAESGHGQRGRPAAWLISAVAHAAILLLLAAVGIQAHRPKDQVALTGSAPEVSEVSMETFELESSEPVNEPTESEPNEVKYEFSPVGEVAVAEFTPEVTPAPPTPAAASMSNTASTAAIQSLKSNSDAKIQFCGVEGGGNHFVYLVDCSKSMGDAFPSARRALLESIEALTPQQRFYVVFYDRKPDYMRISDPQQDDVRSVYATTQNKAALQRWAMQISMDKGWAPYDPMQFALDLKPDVIFLLSDGEFPQKFEDMVKNENKIANLFGDSGPISIIHTISYYSKEGESRMQRIAEQNHGQYRHVPKP